jgi:hypothetical protein
MLEKLKAKGREVLVLFTAVAMLMSVALGVVGDAIILLLTGALGWALSEGDKK